MPNWRIPTTLPLLPFGAPDQGLSTARVTSPFGWRDNPLIPGGRSWHNGLDIGNERMGDDVVAVADGTVLAEGWIGQPWTDASPVGAKWAGTYYGGIMAVLDHGDGWVSSYAHLADTLVSKGQSVKAGDVIAHIGNTGSAQVGGAHLHFTIFRTMSPQDPWPLITAPLPAEESMPTDWTGTKFQQPKVVRLRKGAPVYDDEFGQKLQGELIEDTDFFLPGYTVGQMYLVSRLDRQGTPVWIYQEAIIPDGEVPYRRYTLDDGSVALVADLRTRIAAAKTALG